MLDALGVGHADIGALLRCVSCHRQPVEVPQSTSAPQGDARVPTTSHDSPARKQSSSAKHGRREVVVHREQNELKQRLGMNMRSYHGVKGTWISAITPGGIIDRTKHIRVGDVICSINGRPLLDADHSDVLAELKRCDATFNIVVAKRVPTDEPGDTNQTVGAHMPRPTAKTTPSTHQHSAPEKHAEHCSTRPIVSERAVLILGQVGHTLSTIRLDLDKADCSSGPLCNTDHRNQAWAIVRKCQAELDSIVTSEFRPDMQEEARAHRSMLVQQCEILENRFEEFAVPAAKRRVSSPVRVTNLTPAASPTYVDDSAQTAVSSQSPTSPVTPAADASSESAALNTDEMSDVESPNTEPVNPAAKEAHIDAANIHVAIGTIASRVRTPHPVAEQRHGRHTTIAVTYHMEHTQGTHTHTQGTHTHTSAGLLPFWCR